MKNKIIPLMLTIFFVGNSIQAQDKKKKGLFHPTK